jgi:molybdopterin molybdotransferase
MKDICASSNLITAKAARDYMLNHTQPIQEVEKRFLLEASHCILATAIQSMVAVPGGDNSAMDGYAFNFQEFENNWYKPFSVSQRISAGVMPSPLQPGTVVRIFTGALLPPGADTVVPQEMVQCLNDDSENQMVLLSAVPKNSNVRPMGDDIALGKVIAEKGKKLTPATLGLIASVGVAEVAVFRPLRVAVLSTGDELRQPGEILEHPAQIYNSNRIMLLSALASHNFQAIDLGTVKDNPQATETTLLQAAAQADVIISTGGASVGEADYVKAVLSALGEVALWNIAIKPGKPVMFGKIKEIPFIGLPGNPVSAFFTFHYFVLPVLRKMQGEVFDQNYPSPYFWVKADFSTSGKEKRLEFLRARLDYRDGQPHAILFPNQSSGVLSSVAWAQGLVEIPPSTRIHVGDDVAYWPFSSFLS